MFSEYFKKLAEYFAFLIHVAMKAHSNGFFLTCDRKSLGGSSLSVKGMALLDRKDKVGMRAA